MKAVAKGLFFLACAGIAAAESPDNPHGELGEMACTMCHSTESWSPLREDTSFRHERDAGWPLEGAHGSLQCLECHELRFQDVDSDCASCHLDVHEGASGFDCLRCHSTGSWRDPSFFEALHAELGFRLVGGHEGLACDRCHQAEDYSSALGACLSCHLEDYRSAANPDHLAQGLGTDCGACHEAASWTPARVDHARISGWPLLGAHDELGCTTCHGEASYGGLDRACAACHQADYDQARAPDHRQGDFPLECTLCHGQLSWQGAAFDHSTGSFPLLGAHQGLACAACHVDGQYADTPTACVFCHQADYDGARNPDHRQAGFPEDCRACHTETGWAPASFDHDGLYFPIESGEHAGEWGSCTDCHTTAGDYSVFSCLECHEHRRSEMDGEHEDVGGYVYESEACLSCHPDGREHDAPAAPRRFPLRRKIR